VSDTLVEAARAVQQRAYAPYSRFRVGCALEAEDGRVFLGCNVENASYGLTICAERAAVCAAVSDADPPAAPCGACRQVLSEFGGDLRVDAVSAARTLSWTIAELLPAAFGKEQLA
jgi:cytidine deaminase